MKILLINDKAEKTGGAEISVFGTKKLLAKLGHQAFFFGFGDDKVDDGIVVPHKNSSLFRVVERFFFSPRIYFILRNFIKKSRPDIIHLHNNYQYSNSVLLALKHSKVPVIHTVHDWGLMCPSSWGVYNKSLKDCTLAKGIDLKCYFHEGCLSFHHFLLTYFRNKLRFRLERKVVKYYIPPSKALARDLKKFGFYPVSCLHHFVEFKELKKLKREGNLLLYVGGLTRNKGVEFLVKAMPLIQKQVPSVKLRVIGDGPELEHLRSISKDLEQVEFLGRVPHEKVMEEYLRSTLFVMPSLWMENSPFVLYECLIASLPIVASDRGGIPDLVKDGFNGFLVKPGDEEDLANKVVSLLKDKSKLELFSKNAKKIIKDLDVDSYIKLLKSYYERIIS